MTSTNVRPESLQDWPKMFDGIYGEHNDALYTTDDIFRQIGETGSKISEAVRKESSIAEIAPLAAIYFGWLNGLWNRLDKDMEGFGIAEVVWYKYPGVCPYCHTDKRCVCITEERKYNPQDISLNVFRRDVKNMPQTLRGWQAMFKGRYGNINRIQPVTSIWLHVLEEVGEVSRELRHGNREKIKEENADVLAQFLGFCTRLGIDLDEVTWRTYPGECNVCHEEKCTCPYD